MNIQIKDYQWQKIIDQERKKNYFIELEKKIQIEYQNYRIFPKSDLIFRALELTPFDQVKVVILGQDPYHEVNQANGLAFSVSNDTKIPKSLVNIFKELHNDLGYQIPISGDLEKWAKRGVLLLNTILTVREHSPLSHQKIGWEIFTDELIRQLDAIERPIVFILWGNYAIGKKSLLNNPNHLIITSPHPSPLSASRGFFNSKPFSRANIFLQNNEVDWNLY